MAPRTAVPEPIDLVSDEDGSGLVTLPSIDDDPFTQRLLDWVDHPVHFVCEALYEQPDPWQCDVLDAIAVEDNVALRACHGVGKTKVEGWAVCWFLATRAMSQIVT